jgi:hypothetical protein
MVACLLHAPPPLLVHGVYELSPMKIKIGGSGMISFLFFTPSVGGELDLYLQNK